MPVLGVFTGWVPMTTVSRLVEHLKKECPGADVDWYHSEGVVRVVYEQEYERLVGVLTECLPRIYAELAKDGYLARFAVYRQNGKPPKD